MGDDRQKSRSELVQEGLSFLEQRLESGRALVLLRNAVDGSLIVEASRGVSPEELAEPQSLTNVLLRSTRQRGKPSLVLDAGQDPQFQQVPDALQQRFRSALCVPLQDGGRRLTGLLYADRPTQAFSDADLHAVVGFAKQLGQDLDKAVRREALAPPPSEPRDAGWRALAVPVFVLALAVAWALVGVLTGGGTDAPGSPDPSPAVLTSETADPLLVARTFLACLRSQDLASAWELLSPSLQQKLPREEFTRQANDWLADDLNRWELDYRRPVKGADQGTGGRILVQDAHTGKPDWSWTLIRTDKGWKIDAMAMEGAPLPAEPPPPAPAPGVDDGREGEAAEAGETP